MGCVHTSPPALGLEITSKNNLRKFFLPFPDNDSEIVFCRVGSRDDKSENLGELLAESLVSLITSSLRGCISAKVNRDARKSSDSETNEANKKNQLVRESMGPKLLVRCSRVCDLRRCWFAVFFVAFCSHHGIQCLRKTFVTAREVHRQPIPASNRFGTSAYLHPAIFMRCQSPKC